MVGDAGEWVATADLAPWVGNPRRNDKAVAAVAKSIERFGFGAPIVANARTREIIAGHTRLQAARKLGLRSVPVRWLDLSPAEGHALALVDNKLAEVARWDGAKLADAVCALAAANEAALDWVGFSQAELRELGVGVAAAGSGGFDGLPAGPPDARQLSFTLDRAQLAQVRRAVAAVRASHGQVPEAAAVFEVCASFVGGAA
jgi:ParB-like chromosome segregation protein Spo0J